MGPAGRLAHRGCPALLAVLEGVKRASRDWVANNRNRTWLVHQTYRLTAAEWLSARPDLAASLQPTIATT